MKQNMKKKKKQNMVNYDTDKQNKEGRVNCNMCKHLLQSQ